MKKATIKKGKGILSQIGNTIKQNPKTTMYVGGALLTLYLLPKAIRNVKEALDFGKDPNAGGGNPDPNASTTIPKGASITKNQAQNIAAALHQAMVVWNGTDEDKIFQLLKGKNQKDYAMISQAFSKPRYDDFGDAYWPFPQQPLSYWLNSELNDKELIKLGEVIPGVF